MIKFRKLPINKLISFSLVFLLFSFQNTYVSEKSTVSAEGTVYDDFQAVNSEYFQNFYINNVSYNTYDYYAKTSKVSCYYEQGQPMTVMYNGLSNEVYIYSLMQNAVKKIKNPLSIYGGYYSSDKYHYLVFGAENLDDSDEVEVIRVVQYTKDWKELNHISLSGCNTSIPFHCGTLRADSSDGVLYFYTSHQMYTYNDGRPQSNMMFSLDEETLTLLHMEDKIMNVTETGYVSHSLDQYIKADEDEYLYCLDLGDFYPRGLTLVKKFKNPHTTENADGEEVYDYGVQYRVIATPLPSSETDFATYTGISAGGLELFDGYCAIGYSSIEPELDDNYYVIERNFESSADVLKAQKNVNIALVNKNNLQDVLIYRLTRYSPDDEVKVGTPQILKINDKKFIVMWEECEGTSFGADTKTYAVLFEKHGDSEFYAVNSSNPLQLKARLSDCQPILSKGSEPEVTWVSLNSVDMFAINRLRLQDLYKYLYKNYDINNDEKLNVSDFMLLKMYMLQAPLKDYSSSVYDLNGDGRVNIIDLMRLQLFLINA